MHREPQFARLMGDRDRPGPSGRGGPLRTESPRLPSSWGTGTGRGQAAEAARYAPPKVARLMGDRVNANGGPAPMGPARRYAVNRYAHGT
jgi:hypothetical protein